MTHLIDTRRDVGFIGRGAARVAQYPVICAVDLIAANYLIARGDKVTIDPPSVTCSDCLERIAAGVPS